MLTSQTKAELLAPVKEARKALKAGKILEAESQLQSLEERLLEVPLVEEMLIQTLEENLKERRVPYFRVISPTHDSGWMLTGERIENNVARYARKNGVEDGYFVSKRDYLERERWTDESPVSQDSKPWRIFRCQEDWADQFPLPSDLQEQLAQR
jgi:hypothetical protein